MRNVINSTFDVWGVIGVAAAAGSAVAAVVSIALLLWFRYRDRPSADWILEPLSFVANSKFDLLWKHNGNGKPDESILLTNVGDGNAYRLEATGRGCKVMFYTTDGSDFRGFRTPSVLPRIAPADFLGVFLWHDDIRARASERILLTWREAPARRKRKRSVDFAKDLKQIQDRFEADHPKSTN